MPDVLLATKMDSGHVKWRPKFSLSGDGGPADRTLVIEFSGSLEGLKWISTTPYAVDLDALVPEAADLFDRAWLRGKGSRPAEVTGGSGKFSVTVKV